MDCLFCKIISKKIKSHIIYENEYVVSFLDLFPNSNGHCLVIPKKHFANFSETEELYLIEVTKAKKKIVNILKEKLNPVGFNYVSNEGSEAFQMIFHYHEHIVPKYKKEEGLSFNINKVNIDDIENIYKKIK